jgi:hypothetical protein
MRRTYAGLHAVCAAITLWGAVGWGMPSTAATPDTAPTQDSKLLVEFPLNWYSYPEIAQRLSVEGRTVKCAPNLQQCVALVHLKPRPWEEVVKLLSSGLEVRLRKTDENRWVLERDPQVVAREQRWRQQFRAYLVKEALQAVRMGTYMQDYPHTLFDLFTPSERKQLSQLRPRVSEWMAANRKKYASERSFLEAAPLGASEVGASVWQKVEKWVQGNLSGLRRYFGALDENRTLLTKAVLLSVLQDLDRLQIRELFRSLSSEQLLELSQLWTRIYHWERQWFRDYGDAYKDYPDEERQARMRDLPLSRSDVSEGLWRVIEQNMPLLKQHFQERNGAFLSPDATTPQLEEKIVLYYLAFEQDSFRSEYFRQLLRSVLQDEATLRAMVEKAFERGLFVHVVSLPALVNDPTLLAWSVSSKRYSENLLREVEAQPQEWYLVLSAHWSPSRLDLEIFHIPIHLTGLFPTYDWYQVLRFVEPDSVRDWLSSVLGEEAKELMTRWQAEMEDALQSQFAQQVVEIEKPSESLLPQIVAWAQASGVEIILELLPSRDTRLVHTPRQFSLKQLLSAKTYDAPILLRLRVLDEVLIVSSMVSFLDRWTDYPAAALLKFARDLQRHEGDRFPLKALEVFCQAVSPEQVGWLNRLSARWIGDEFHWRLIGGLKDFYCLYHGVLRGQVQSIVEKGGEISFAQWSPEAVQQLLTLLRATLGGVFYESALLFHPRVALRFPQHGIKVHPVRTVPLRDISVSPGDNTHKQPELEWRLLWQEVPPESDFLMRFIGFECVISKSSVQLIGAESR